jgi:hypothetical protein
MIPVGWKTRRSWPPQRSHLVGPSSNIEWTTSLMKPQLRHW